jgi:hypothetical protein
MSYLPERRMGSVSLGLAVAGGLVVGGIVLTVALWLLGMVAGIVMFALKLGVLVALAAGVVWAVRTFLGDRERV